MIVQDFGVESRRMLLHALHECRTLQTVYIAWPVVDVRRGHQLTTWLDAGDQQRVAIRARGIDGGRVASGPGAEDDQRLVTCLHSVDAW